MTFENDNRWDKLLAAKLPIPVPARPSSEVPPINPTSERSDPEHRSAKRSALTPVSSSDISESEEHDAVPLYTSPSLTPDRYGSSILEIDRPDDDSPVSSVCGATESEDTAADSLDVSVDETTSGCDDIGLPRREQGGNTPDYETIPYVKYIDLLHGAQVRDTPDYETITCVNSDDEDDNYLFGDKRAIGPPNVSYESAVRGSPNGVEMCIGRLLSDCREDTDLHGMVCRMAPT